MSRSARAPATCTTACSTNENQLTPGLGDMMPPSPSLELAGGDAAIGGVGPKALHVEGAGAQREPPVELDALVADLATATVPAGAREEVGEHLGVLVGLGGEEPVEQVRRGQCGAPAGAEVGHIGQVGEGE